ncbi:hypothetical protein H6P81_019365 [Aristolochia fimbriata]|uniref:Uncharacterized protein n=1 Tax=Aristolochia fimbriata TaxID=158543 RepID=A0AAV7DRL4_ARIFI|nr:hypothetical protein H6P81_019365 [Aristolochia fimbriata]
MVLLEKLWDDVIAGPHPDRGLGKLRKVTTRRLSVEVEGESSSGNEKFQRSLTMPATPATPATPTTPTTPSSAKKDNVWRSVFNPGSNLATRTIGAQVFDKPHPNSPTVYDWKSRLEALTCLDRTRLVSFFLNPRICLCTKENQNFGLQYSFTVATPGATTVEVGSGGRSGSLQGPGVRGFAGSPCV